MPEGDLLFRFPSASLLMDPACLDRPKETGQRHLLASSGATFRHRGIQRDLQSGSRRVPINVEGSEKHRVGKVPLSLLQICRTILVEARFFANLNAHVLILSRLYGSTSLIRVLSRVRDFRIIEFRKS